MSEESITFNKKSSLKAFDLEHRRKINFNISRYNAVVPLGKQQFTDLDGAREKAKNIKWKAIENLDKQLEEFELRATDLGIKVVWAQASEDALNEILKIARLKNCSTIVKSKSVVTEEIHLNKFLEQHNIESIETDLGEYIQQLDNEPPYHIVTPAMHKSKEDVAKLFEEKLGTAASLTPTELTLVARRKLREKYRQAEIGITGANFIIADSGGIAITENEGNGRLTCSWPKTHIVIVGIEKIIPSIADLDLFWPLLSTYGTGQEVTVYNSIICGPRQSGEIDGPGEMYVILLDNGRTNILSNTTSRESLYCIRCGACLNACPVYKNIGGHAYGTTYSGPIGSVITPHLKQMDEWKHLSYASSLCGNCTEVCAVKINLHELLLENRHEAVEQKSSTFTERITWNIWKRSMLKRGLMNAGSGSVKGWFINHFLNQWTKNRSKIDFPSKSFNQMWQEKNKQ